MSEINYQEGHEKAGQAKPVAWRYRYVKKGVTDSQGEPWVGDWKYVPTKRIATTGRAMRFRSYSLSRLCH
ncbi:putative prophage protein [Escherichia coli]|uniref:Putative prophage protein n=1 Tax=Escherichia coli TaxID=562 RepID=A0A447XGQ1_ECOLX|nr:putative prophage protein [Escherichia coli]